MRPGYITGPSELVRFVQPWPDHLSLLHSLGIRHSNRQTMSLHAFLMTAALHLMLCGVLIQADRDCKRSQEGQCSDTLSALQSQ